MERIENRTEYHDVIANSLASIVRLIAANSDKETGIAKKLVLFNIRQAYTLYRLDEPANLAEVRKKLEDSKGKKNGDKIDIDHVLMEELEEMGLEEKNIDNLSMDELLTKMFAYQTLAGIKPVQSFKNTAKVFARSRSELNR